MSKARELSKLLSGTLKVGALQAPAGTTAQRPSGQVGQIRYNSETGKNETYDSGGWGAIATPPLITTVSPSTYNGEAGTLFTINGSFFDVGAGVKFITNAGIEYTASVVTRVNASQLTATTPQDFTVAQEPLKVKVINPSGLNYTLDAAIDCGGVPSWNTAAGNIATVIEDEAISAITLSAGDPDAGATVSYLINSGALPTGLSLSAGGTISGTPNVNDAYSTGVTYNFDIAARDNAGNQTLRSFNIIKKWRDGLSADTASNSAANIKAVVGSPASGVYWLRSAGINSGVPFQCYCDFTLDGGIGYAIYFNKFFDSSDNGSGNGFEAGPNFTSMSSQGITGTAGYSNEYNIYPYLMPSQYNNGAGASRMIIFVRNNAGSSTGGVHSATYKYNRLTGLSATAMRDIWTGYPSLNAYSASFMTFGNTGLRDSGSGTTYFQGSHGSSGGVVQCVSDASTVNSKIVFEYKPVGFSEDSSKSDPNHYWMVDNGSDAASYFRSHPQYGNNAGIGSQASGVFGIRYGGIAIY